MVKKWIRNPSHKAIERLGYWFWFRESLHDTNTLFINNLFYGNKWDIRWWLQAPLLPVLYLMVPIAKWGYRYSKYREIEKCRAIYIHNDKSLAEYNRLIEQEG